MKRIGGAEREKSTQPSKVHTLGRHYQNHNWKRLKVRGAFRIFSEKITPKNYMKGINKDLLEAVKGKTNQYDEREGAQSRVERLKEEELFRLKKRRVRSNLIKGLVCERWWPALIHVQRRPNKRKLVCIKALRDVSWIEEGIPYNIVSLGKRISKGNCNICNFFADAWRGQEKEKAPRLVLFFFLYSLSFFCLTSRSQHTWSVMFFLSFMSFRTCWYSGYS